MKGAVRGSGCGCEGVGGAGRGSGWGLHMRGVGEDGFYEEGLFSLQKRLRIPC